MFRRRRVPVTSAPLAAQYASFLRVLDMVEAAKEVLVSAAPTGRPARLSLAEALAGFEQGLAAARQAMADWRSEATEPLWIACRSALEEAARRAERLRLEGSPEGYEGLVAVLGSLLEPLQAFGRGEGWFEGLRQDG